MRWLLLVLFLAVTTTGIQAQRSLAKAHQQFEVCAFSNALELYLEALDKADDREDVIAHIAMCYEALGENLQSVQWYEKIVDSDGVNPEYLLQYAQLLKRLNLQGKAKFYFLKYAQYAPDAGKHFAASCDFARAEQKYTSEYSVELAPFNSEHADFNPSFYKDQLVFASFRTDVLPAGTRDDKELSEPVTNQIYWVPRQSATNIPVSLSTEVTSFEGIAPFHYSANGKWIAFTRNKWTDGNRLFSNCDNLSIFTANVSHDGKWDQVQAFPYNDNDYANTYPCLSEDGTIMYFASNRPGGSGGFDIWMSIRTHDGWTKPENLGPSVNSPGNEITPFFTGRTLFFASDYHTGLGGFDIFKTANTNGQWSAPFHLGAGINSERDDFGYVCSTSDGPGYFVSDRVSGRGRADIYMATPEFREITVQVLDQETEQPVPFAEINFVGSERFVTTNTFGRAILHQPLNSEKEILVQRNGYKDLRMRMTNGTGDIKPREYAIHIQQAPVEMFTQVKETPAKQTPGTANTGTSGGNPSANAGMQQSGSTAGATSQPVAQQQANNRETTADTQQPVRQKIEKITSPEIAPPSSFDRYAVQVAAVASSNVDLSGYSDLKAFGDVMSADEGKMTKIRVGYFTSRLEAQRKVSQIRSAGYGDAFMVIVPGKKIEQEEKAQAMKEAVAHEEYKVRLATYSDPGNFNPTAIAELGEIQSYTKNAYTIMLLSGFNSRSEAEQARKIVNARGFPDAYVVIDKDGALIRAK